MMEAVHVGVIAEGENVSERVHLLLIHSDRSILLAVYLDELQRVRADYYGY